jgi:CheY-like chemotaxis protein
MVDRIYTPKILIVEDNRVNQLLMKKIINRLQCEYYIAENGLEAINALENDTFSLIFMDCSMPILDGWEATQKIRNSNKPYSLIPIIAVTANTTELDKQKCITSGMDDFIPKPVNPTAIRAIIDNVLLKTNTALIMQQSDTQLKLLL